MTLEVRLTSDILELYKPVATIDLSNIDALFYDRFKKEIETFSFGIRVHTIPDIDMKDWGKIKSALPISFYNYPWHCFKATCITSNNGREISLNFMDDLLNSPDT